MKTKYELMGISDYKDDDGNNFPDLATFELDKLVYSTKPSSYTLNYNDTQRFFDCVYSLYGEFDFYEDILLWMNDILDIIDEKYFDKTISLPSKNDMDDWYLKYFKEN